MCRSHFARFIGWNVRIGNEKLSEHFFHHVLGPSRWLSSILELCNLLAVAKSHRGLDFLNDHFSFVERARQYLVQYVDKKEGEHRNLVSFVAEQLDLCQMQKHARSYRYSFDTISVSFMWFMTSRALYLKLKELIPLAICSTTSTVE